jgi:hypothetical protein
MGTDFRPTLEADCRWRDNLPLKVKLLVFYRPHQELSISSGLDKSLKIPYAALQFDAPCG